MNHHPAKMGAVITEEGRQAVENEAVVEVFYDRQGYRYEADAECAGIWWRSSRPVALSLSPERVAKMRAEAERVAIDDVIVLEATEPALMAGWEGLPCPPRPEGCPATAEQWAQAWGDGNYYRVITETPGGETAERKVEIVAQATRDETTRRAAALRAATGRG